MYPTVSTAHAMRIGCAACTLCTGPVLVPYDFHCVQLEELEALEALSGNEAAVAAARRRLKDALAQPFMPIQHVVVDQIADGLDSVGAQKNATTLGEMASKLQKRLQTEGEPKATLALTPSLTLTLIPTPHPDPKP